MAPVSSVEQLTTRASRVVSMLLQLCARNPAAAQRLLVRAAAAGSVYALLAAVLGGLYQYPWQLPGVVLRLSATIVATLAKYVARGGKPLFPEWTLPYELLCAVLRSALSNYGDRITSATNAPIICRQSELLGMVTGHFAGRRNGTTTQAFLYNGLEHLWVRSTVVAPPTATASKKPAQRVVLLYYHGGGYVLLSPRMYTEFASEMQCRIRKQLADQLGGDLDVHVDVLLANYRKAPEHPYPRATLDTLTMYKYLLEEEKLAPRHIIVMGDSAGGGLTMTTLLNLRDEDPALLPAAAIVSCPNVDREVKGDETKTPYCILADRLGKGIGEAYYRGEGSPSTWGNSSPVHCSLRGLPPVYIQAAEFDYILHESTRLMQKAQDDGLTGWKLEIFPHMPHVFTTTPPSMLPIAGKGIDAMAEYAATHFALSLQ